MRVIALSHGGTGTETCDPEPIGYVEAHQLAKAGRDWIDSGKTAVDAEHQANSDDVFYMRLALAYMTAEDLAIGAGTYKAPDVIQREIAVAKFHAANPA
jgi:hypothetical protein